MTRERKTEILNDLLEQGYNAIPHLGEEDMASDRIAALLHNLSAAEQLRQVVSWDGGDTDLGSDAQKCEPEAESPTAAPEEQTQEDTETAITKEELKKKLLTLGNQYDALDVASIMNGMGYDRLSDIPANRYAELLSKVESAVEGLA